MGKSRYQKDKLLEVDYRIDLPAGGKVIIELKAVENLSEIYLEQLITYLKLSSKD